MQVSFGTFISILIILVLSIIFLKIGEIIGEKLAKRRMSRPVLDFKTELKRRIEEWKQRNLHQAEGLLDSSADDRKIQ